MGYPTNSMQKSFQNTDVMVSKNKSDPYEILWKGNSKDKTRNIEKSGTYEIKYNVCNKKRSNLPSD